MLTYNISKSIITIVLLLTFFSCKTTENFVDKPPYANINAWTQPWIGGAFGTGSGTKIHVSADFKETILPDTIYYNEQKNKVKIISKSPKLIFETNLTKVTPKEHQISQNTSSLLDKDNIAKKGELVFGFVKNNKRFYYKIVQFKKKPTLMYASARPQN